MAEKLQPSSPWGNPTPTLTSRKDNPPHDQPVGRPLNNVRKRSWLDAHRPSQIPRADGKRELKQNHCWDKLAYSWPRWKKAMYLASIAGIQISMNFNTSVFPSAVNPIAEHFGISTQKARIGQMIYLVAYSFGCELWAPWSEEFGRWPILQLSMLLINLWQIPNMFAKNFGTIVVGRALVSQRGAICREHRLTFPGWTFNGRRERNFGPDCGHV
jgi:hypothetical protein